MKKFKSVVYGYEMLIFIGDNGDVYTKSEKRNTNRMSNCTSVIGGKWKKMKTDNQWFLRNSVEKWLSDIDAIETNFRGSPRTK